VLFTAADRKPASTTEERAALQNPHIAYTGLVAFEPDPSDASRLKMTNKVDIAWNAEWAGTTQVRFLSLEGNRLTIKTPLIKNPYTGQQTVSTLVFQRSR
jgi:Lipocalin-like domain